MSVAFLLTSLIVIATPGTGAVYTIAAALARGWRGGLVAALANGVCLVPHVLAVITGLASVLHASALAFSVVKYLGVGYLIYLAVTSWRGSGRLSLQPDARRQPPSTRAVFFEAMVLNLLNPKLTLFFVAFLPQFVDPAAPDVIAQMVQLSGWFALFTVLVYAVYAALAAAIRAHVLARPTVLLRIERSFAAVFAILAVRLVVARA